MQQTNPHWLVSQAPQDLKAQIRIAVGQGFHVTSQTEKTAQLLRGKRFSVGAAILWLLVAGIGLLFYFLYYLSKSDDTVYLDVDSQPSKEEMAKMPKPRQRSFAMKFLIGIGVVLVLSTAVGVIGALVNDASSDAQKAAVVVLSPEEQAKQLKEVLAKDLADAKAYKPSEDILGTDKAAGTKAARELYGKWGADVKLGRVSKDPDTVKLAEDLAKQVARIQVVMYPIMRKAYAEVASDKLWRVDAKVRTIGAGNRIIIFTSATFAANANSADMYQTVQHTLFDLRFTEVRFEWYEGSSYVNWDNLTDTKDGDIK